jgi:hypothetical protein
VSKLAVLVGHFRVLSGLFMLAERVMMVCLVMVMRSGMMVRGRGVMMFLSRMFLCL